MRRSSELTPVDEAAASESGEIDEITFDGFDIDDDGASLVVHVPDDAGATASTGGIELVAVDALLASVDSLETADGEVPSPPAAEPPLDVASLAQRLSGLPFPDRATSRPGTHRRAATAECGRGGADAGCPSTA